jgi:hypothetical protein
LARKTAQEDLNKAQATFNKLTPYAAAANAGEGIRDRWVAAGAQIRKAQGAIEDISKSIKQVEEEQKGFLSDAQKSAAAAGNMYFSNQPAEQKERVKREVDGLNEISQEQKMLSDAIRDAKVQDLNQTISVNEAIFNNEKKSIDERAAAYAEMYVSRLQLAGINRDKELKDVTDWFGLYQGEVDKANATEISKQTEHQKALLIRYERYTVRKIAIDNKYQADVAKINTDVSNDLVETLVNEDQIRRGGCGTFPETN